MLRKPRRLGLLVVFFLTLILGFKTVPSAITRYPYEIPAPMGEITKAELDFAPPLQTAGRHIVDANGKRYKLASINWYGGSDIFFVPMGLDVRHRSEIAKTIKKMGFNSVRFPYSDQMVLENPIVDPRHLQANLDLLEPYSDRRQGVEQTRLEESASGPRALDVFNACVTALTDEGITVIPNNHITNAAWCDGKNLCDSSWKNSQYGPICKIYQTTESWIENWKTIMKPFIDNPLVIGADLRNEPRGLWGTMTWSMWASAAEQASEALLAMQPNWLMFGERLLWSSHSPYQALNPRSRRVQQPRVFLVRLGRSRALSQAPVPVLRKGHGAQLGLSLAFQYSPCVGGRIWRSAQRE
jgi:endoglucanase